MTGGNGALQPESDLALFRRRLLRNPRQVSAIAPSSRTLARAMTLGIGPGSGQVVEFGPGTGRFTEALLARGLPPEKLTLFELDDEFVPYLRRKFPGVTVHQAGAETAARLIRGKVCAVISGLPLLSMPDEIREAIVTAAFDILAPRGSYVQFTYGQRPPLPPGLIAELGLKVNRGHKIWANLPPARVYRFRKA
ncbi:class I SAM-dependent methyltransferase [Pseudogemmobacter faecipullorum]|uniref:Methyltransferase domain-containing protein n=1 Tax=Pseudogemmobacter faecipullorum TaxID=2755041 RepID=A0ABS8CKZ4_9RHOB|nr:methyltransferase domain-containing protein [Pseudogemmobacter faecipullorum]MCB5410063.1 methyltransferase domain-containing protein [Pseudogemmobacter faecipullorum]